MKFASAFSDNEDFKENVKEFSEILKKELGQAPSLIFVFVSRFFIDYASTLPKELRQHFPEAQIIGCIGSVLLEGNREEAYSPGIVAMGAFLPKADVKDVHVEPDSRPGEDDSPAAWRNYIGLEKSKNQNLIVFADPFTPDVDAVLQGIDYAYSCPVAGGFSSGTQFKGEVSLYAGDRSVNGGLVMVSISGNVDVVPIVAQGCRPIGESLTVTSCENVVLTEVNNMSPMDYLQSISGALDNTDKSLLQQSLFLGVEMNDLMKADLSNGDYLIRNIRGVSPEDGALVVGEHLQQGQSVRFHVRDPQSSRQELSDIVERLSTKLASRDCKGILVFSCLGRVEEFYEEAAVDSKVIRGIQQDAPLAGFFCSGEIGQVGGSTYVHGYTASAIMFFETGK